MTNKFLKLAIILSVTALLASCGENGGENGNGGNNLNTRLIPVETVTISDGDFDDYIRLTGTVEALEDAVISAETSGRVISIVNRGARVQRGDIIARLDDRLIQAQYNAAKAGFDLAEDTYNRLQTLYADSIVSTQDFNNAAAQKDQAQAQLSQAEKQLRDARIAAPFSGRVESRMINTGELINPGQPVVRLVNSDRVRIVTGIPERYTGEIEEGSDVDIFIRSVASGQLGGEISYAGSVIDPETRTFAAEIELDNTEGQIRPDMIVDLQVKRSTFSGVIIIPRTAVLRDEQGANVFVARQENGRKIAELVAVTTSAASGPFVQITSGLQLGDEVVVSGMRTLSQEDELNILKNETNLERIEYLRQNDRPAASF